VIIAAANTGGLGPGFSDGEVSQRVDTGAVADSIVTEINRTVNQTRVEEVATVINTVTTANAEATLVEVVQAIVDRGTDVVAISPEIIVSVVENTSADTITAIVDVVQAIASVTNTNNMEVLQDVVASIPQTVWDNLPDVALEVDWGREAPRGLTVEIPATTFLSVLVEHNVTEVSFAGNAVAETSNTFVDTVAAVAATPALGANTTVSQVLNLGLRDQNQNYVRNFGGEVTVSLPITGNVNSVGHFNPLTNAITMLPSRVVGTGNSRFVEFRTTHFSSFVLMEAPAAAVVNFETAAPPPVAPDIGRVLGNVLYSDVRALINGREIPSFNIDGLTMIRAEDLQNYGFEVIWNASARTLNVASFSSARAVTPLTVEATGRPSGAIRTSYVSTDIRSFVNGVQVRGYNIGGETMIQFDHLRAFGRINWNASLREITLITTN